MTTFFRVQEETINHRAPTVLNNNVPEEDMDIDIDIDDKIHELKIAALDFTLYRLKEHIKNPNAVVMHMDLFEWQNKFNWWLELSASQRKQLMR